MDVGNPLFTAADCPTSGFAVGIHASGRQGRKLPHRSCKLDPDENALIFRAQSKTKNWIDERSEKFLCVLLPPLHCVLSCKHSHKHTHLCVFPPSTHPSREACHGNGSSLCLLEGRQLRATWQTLKPTVGFCASGCVRVCVRAKTAPVGQSRIPCPALVTWLALAHMSK